MSVCIKDAMLIYWVGASLNLFYQGRVGIASNKYFRSQPLGIYIGQAETTGREEPRRYSYPSIEHSISYTWMSLGQGYTKL